MYKAILVPHAGTPAGDNALKHAIHAAKNSSAKIIILHIIEEIQRPPISFGLAESEREKIFDSIKDANESIRQEMEKVMEKLSQQCNDESIETKVKVEMGDAAEIILDTIQNENIDLVVMAKRRKLKGVKKLLSLGSVSRKVVENVTCPVILLDVDNT
ncbi:universal stress protein [Nitrosopumilus maritimus]|uniref:UspA domain protein n=1 Tax=Nitrosopumilus maritimus (strain SCM1) TaxID=436308 RepID=A9A3H6_NITMS|nr:universal stress protein [Nitrosopumilus maritimus]ABX12908.1 UspA domain protein [Nitrosopumilus maritimus SCM1]